MTLSPHPGGSSSCCSSSLCSHQVRDHHLVQGHESCQSHGGVDSVDHCASVGDPQREDSCCQTTGEVSSVDEDLDQKNQTNKEDNACFEVEGSKQRGNCCAVEDDKSSGEEPKGCCEIDGSNKETCCEATGDGHPNTENDFAGGNCCENNTTPRSSCCGVSYLKRHEKEDGPCCDGKWSL